MFTVIGFMFIGILVGYLTRKHELTKIGQLITTLIWILLFLLGFEVGSNKQIIESLGTLGLEAISISLAAILGSCVGACILWFLLYKKAEEKV